MIHRFFEPGSRQDVVVIPIIWLMIVLSILVHVAALFLLLMHLLRDKDQEQTEASDRLQVRLAAQATPAPPVARLQEPEPPQPVVKPPKATVRIRPPPMVAPPKREAPAIPLPPPPPPVSTPPPVAAAPPSADFGSMVQAKRSARGEREAPESEDEKALFDSKIAANLPTASHGVAAQTRNGGGIFQIKRMAYDDAAFEFYGWNKEMGRRTPQLIEVRKGDNADMRIAVVRRMIAIIREHEKEDFVWENPQKDRKYTLSARISDNAALEAFLLNEFFGVSGSFH